MAIYFNKDQIYNDNYLTILLLIIICGLLACSYYGCNNNNNKINKSNNKSNNKLIIVICSLIFVIVIFAYVTNINKNIKQLIQNINNINDDNYDVIIIDNFLTLQECDKLIEYSQTQQLITSETLGDYGNVTTDYRKSEQLWIRDEQNEIARKISDFCEIILDLPKKNMESLQLVKYDVSGYFKEHYDAEPDKTKNNNIKDRAHTFIVYLNDVEEGGETRFPKLDLNYKPKKGSAIYFKTLLPNNILLEKSLHQGMPIIRGEKYIVNKWIHLNKFTI
jgi:prolyl 4-hydroxylase